MIGPVILMVRPRLGLGPALGVRIALIEILGLVILLTLLVLLGVFFVRWLQRRPRPRVASVSKPVALQGVDNVPVSAVELLVLRDQVRRKKLHLRVTYPKTPTTAGKLPVIVFSHGRGGSKDDYQLLVQYWCAHDYVCIQLNHYDAQPPKGKRLSRDLRDWASRPKDVTLVLDSLSDIMQAIPALAERLDPEHVGVGGHSFGAHTAQLLGGMTARNARGGKVSYRDPRVSAVFMLSPQGRGRLHSSDAWSTFRLPMMTITGTKDDGRNGEDYTWRLDPFELSPPGDKYLIVIRDADHGFGGIPRSSAQYPYAHDEEVAGIVQEESVRFWDAYLKADTDAKQALRAGRSDKAISTRVELRTK
jgi:dienelactone hydrolase